MNYRKLSLATVTMPSSVLLIVCGCGVPKDAVIKEANQIDKNADVAQALHPACLDGGSASQPCADELRALADIHANTATLLQAAGASDAGSAVGGDR